MLRFENEINALIKAFDRVGLLKNCIITGSWSMYFYKEIFEDFIPPIATTDFDIFLPDAKKVAKSDLSKALLDLDYIRQDDSLSGKTKYFSKEGFEIEFLTLPDKTMSNVRRIKALGIGAEALPMMQPIMWNYITIRYRGINVNVPSPASFCLQKLLIHEERSEIKKRKDIDAVKYIIGYIALSIKYKEEFIASFNSAPRKWKKRIKNSMLKYGLDTLIGI